MTKALDIAPFQPPNFAPRGREFWERVTDRWELSLPEMTLLVEACRLLDEIELLAESIETHGVMVAGSTGQLRPNPAIGEARQNRLALSRLVAQLALPDEAGETLSTPRQASGKRAMQSRYRA